MSKTNKARTVSFFALLMRAKERVNTEKKENAQAHRSDADPHVQLQKMKENMLEQQFTKIKTTLHNTTHGIPTMDEREIQKWAESKGDHALKTDVLGSVRFSECIDGLDSEVLNSIVDSKIK
jgi:hypothetical protein